MDKLISLCDGAETVVAVMKAFPMDVHIQGIGAWILNDACDDVDLFDKLMGANSLEVLFKIVTNHQSDRNILKPAADAIEKLSKHTEKNL
jgi:hypothetical protein